MEVNNLNIIIRNATKEDADAFNKVISACSEQLNDQGFDHWRDYYTPQKIDERLSKAQTYVATFNGEVIGCVCYDPSVEKGDFVEKYGVELSDKKYAYLTTLAVHPKYQGVGNGDKLMDFVEAIAKRESRIPIITMRFELENLVVMYAKRGYKEIGRMIVSPSEQYCLLTKE